MTSSETLYIFGSAIVLTAGVLFAWKQYRARKVQELARMNQERAMELHREASIGSPVTEDLALRAEFVVVQRISSHADRDAGLERLVGEAVTVGDWWLAMEIAAAMYSHLGKDKALKEIVDVAIGKKEWCLAALAADQMFYKNFQDQAKQRLLDEAGK